MNYILSLTVFLCCLFNSFADVIDPVEESCNQIIMPSRMGKARKWIGKLVVVNEGCKKAPCLLLTGEFAVQQGKYSETGHGRRYCKDGIVGCFYNVSAMVKGSGKIKIGLKSINDKSAKKRNPVKWSKLLELNDKWQSLTLKGQDMNPHCIAHQVLFRREGSGKAYIDDVKLQYSSPRNIKFNVTPQNIIAYPGMEVDIQLELDKKSPVYIRRYQSTSGSKLVSETKIKSKNFKLKVPESVKESYRVSISVPEFGLNRNLFVSLVSQKELKAMESEAAKIKLTKPLNILVIGDSLSDYFRGFNYVNMIDSLLNKFNPGRVNIRNASVGGDFITRVWKRMQGADGQIPPIRVRQYMYNNYLSPSPDLIFIFLGANDSKCSTISNFKTSYVTPKIQEKTYRKVLDYLNKKTKAKIILIGCPSFNYKISGSKSRIEKLLKSKRTRWLFGIDRAIIDFNNVNKKLVAEYNINYIDIFNMTSKNPEKEKLYQKVDGVHLSDKGNRMVALEVLKYLSKNNFNK